MKRSSPLVGSLNTALKKWVLACAWLTTGRVASHAQESPAPPPPVETAPTHVALGGHLYDAAEVEKAYQNARKKFAYDVGSREAVPARQAKAQYVKGTIVQRSGARYMLQSGNEYRIIFIRNGHTPPVDQEVGFMLAERSATIKARIPGGEVISMKQYDDVTILMPDFVRSFNRGVPIAGKQFKPPQMVLGETGELQRLDSQMERRTTKVNRK